MVRHGWETHNHQHVDEYHIQYWEIDDVSLTFEERNYSFVDVFHVHAIKKGPKANGNSQRLECKQDKRQLSEDIEDNGKDEYLQMLGETLVVCFGIVIIIGLDENSTKKVD